MGANLTRRGIARDLKSSPYFVHIEYGRREITYNFSSLSHLTKFKARLQDHRQDVNNLLSRRFGWQIAQDVLADLKLYRDIEKRGFYITYRTEDRKEDFNCLDSLKLNGQTLTGRN